MPQTPQDNTPNANGGGLTFSVSPALPGGLELQPFTGNFVGTPFVGSDFALYTITATNSLGSTSTEIAIAIDAPPPPKNVVYPTSPALLANNANAGSITPTFDGMAAGFLIKQGSDKLPAGMSFDQQTGTISGTPSELKGPSLLAVDAFGFDAVQLASAGGAADDTGYYVFEVMASGASAPTPFFYEQDPLELEVGETALDLPLLGLATYALTTDSDVLPDGLSLNPVTGAIEGVPSAATEPVLLAIEATLNGGGTRRALLPVVVSAPAAPRELAYANNPITYANNVPIQPNVPSVEGQNLSFAVDPALPSGLSLDANTGAISGTPTSTIADTVFTVTATNSAGSTSTGLLLSVVFQSQASAPSALSYADGDYALNVAIAPNVPSVQGDVETWSINPALPAGLSIDSGTGAISGTPTATQAATTHTVTASGPAGTTSASLQIAVALQQPSGVLYPENPALYTQNLAVSANVPSVVGPVDNWVAFPPLPAGLDLDPLTGAITGTPTGIQAATDHTVFAQNAAGNGTALVRITVLDPVPPTAEFDATPTVGEAPLSVQFSDLSTGAVTSHDWDFGDGGNSTLANPLYIYETPGIYDVSLTVSGPFGTDALTKSSFIVVSSGGPLSNLDYPSSTFAVERELEPVFPTFQGLANAFALTPESDPLPEGMSLDPVSGALSGQPQSLTSTPLSVTIEASNGAETTSVTLSVEVGLGGARAAWVANNCEGTISQYGFDPNSGQLLPRGHVFAPSPFELELLRDNSYLLASNNLDDSISVFAVDPIDGDLSEVAGSPFALPGAGNEVPQDVQASTDGAYVYVAAGTGDMLYGYSIDSATGALTQLPSSPFGPYDGAGSLDVARLAGADFLFLLARDSTAAPVVSFAINPDGSLTEVSALTAGTGPEELAFDREGSTLYVVNNGSNDISAYTVATDGSLTELTNSPFAAPSGSMGARALYVSDTAAGDRFLYAAFDDTSIGQWTVEANGDLTQLLPPSVSTGAAAVDVVLDPTGSYAYISNFGDQSLSVFAASTQGGEEGSLQTVPGLPAVRVQECPSSVAFLADQGPASITVDAVYAANFGSNDVNQFAASSFDGSLLPLFPSGVSGGAGSNWIETDLDGAFAYLVSASDASATLRTYSSDSEGALTAIQDVAQGTGAITAHVRPGGGVLQLVQLAEELIYTYPIGADGLLGSSIDTEDIGGIARQGVWDPTGLNFYVTNELDSTLSQFEADVTTGALTPLSPATLATNTGVRALAMHPTGLYLYASSIGSAGSAGDELASFSLDLATGALTQHSASPITAVDTDPVHLAVHPAGRLLFVATRADTIQAYGINTNPSDATEDGSIIPFPVTTAISGTPRFLKFSPQGDLLYVGLEDSSAQVLTYAVDADAVTLTLVDSDATGDTTSSVALRAVVE